MPFTFERLSEEESKRYEELRATAREALPLLSERDLLTVISLVVGTCPYCHDAGVWCQCWNDE